MRKEQIFFSVMPVFVSVILCIASSYTFDSFGLLIVTRNRSSAYVLTVLPTQCATYLINMVLVSVRCAINTVQYLRAAYIHKALSYPPTGP